MFANAGYPSVADIASIFNGRNDGDGWGGNNGWWVIILLLAMWGGFGNGGWGNNGRNASADFTDAAVQRGFDTQTIISKLDGLNNGLCSLGYDQLAQMNQLGNTVQQSAWNIQQAINNDTVANMQNQFALSRQIGDCCCETKGAIKDVQYTMAQEGCATRTQIHETGDAIIQNQNWTTRNLEDTIRNGFAAAEARENARYIRELEAKVNAAERKGELAELYNNLTAYLAPPARPAYLACNPATGSIWPQGNCGQPQISWNNGCGCCNNNNGCC